MKIEKFNSINENLTTDIKKFIENFSDNTDNGIIDWIDSVAPNTKLNDYKFMSSVKNVLIFARTKNFKKLEEYLLIENEIENKEKEIKKLHEKKEKLKITASDEILYKFQEDLLNMDFDNFYKFFIEDSVENSPTNEIEDILQYSEIHPRILKKYKSKIIIGMAANKFNI